MDQFRRSSKVLIGMDRDGNRACRMPGNFGQRDMDLEVCPGDKAQM